MIGTSVWRFAGGESALRDFALNRGGRRAGDSWADGDLLSSCLTTLNSGGIPVTGALRFGAPAPAFLYFFSSSSAAAVIVLFLCRCVF